jgi:hypothetical protein
LLKKFFTALKVLGKFFKFHLVQWVAQITTPAIFKLPLWQPLHMMEFAAVMQIM